MIHSAYDADELEFSVISDTVIFLENPDKEKLLATFNTIHPPPALVVVDTLARSYGGDENSATDMSRFIRTCDAIREATGGAVLIVHHTPKEAGRGPRGSTALLGAVDTAFEIKKEDRVVTLSCTKMKDDEAPDQKMFDLTAVDLEGETSCVLVPTKIVPKKRGTKLTPRERKSLDVLQNLIAEKGEKRKPKTNMTTVSTVPLDDFRERLKSVGVTNRDEPNSERSQWSNIRQSLVSKDAIGVWEISVWIPG